MSLSVGANYQVYPRNYSTLVSCSQNKTVENPNSFSAWLANKDKVCTDGLDDGRISAGEALTSFGKGFASIAKVVINHPILTGLSVAAGAGLTIATGGAALPLMAAAGAAIGGTTIIGGAYKAATAETDGEAKQAFENMGSGTFALVTSAFGAKQALKSAANAGVKTAEGAVVSNPVKNIINCFKIAPDAIKTSGLNIRGNFLTLSTGNIHANSNALRNGQLKYMSKANEAQAYRFNPEGTPDEILANNPGVFQGEDGAFYVKNKWDASSPFKIDTSKEQMIMLYDGMDDMAVCDGTVFKGSYVDTAAFKADGALNYQVPDTLEYSKIINVTKQAPGACVEVPTGTKVQTLEGIATVGEGQVVAIDHTGNPYVTPASNILKRNTPLEGFETAFEALQGK